jgi:PqqD family protein of HPr-rel-A system
MTEARMYMRNTGLVFRLFGDNDFVIVYDQRNGDTYLFSMIVHEILGILNDLPSTIDQLKESLCRRFPEDDPVMISESVDSAVAQLEGADLIRAVVN